MDNPTIAQILEIPKPRSEYGEGSITRRGNRWQISFYDNESRRRWESYSTEVKARKALTTKLTLKEAGKLDAAETRITIDALAKLYLASTEKAQHQSHTLS